jgi:threonine dehydratase
VRIVGVQAENSAPYPLSLRNGEPTEITILPTIADGIAVSKPGILNFDIIRSAVDEVVTVSDDDIARAILVLLERAKLVVEPAGAVSVAAILMGLVKSGPGSTVAILSGGNIDPLVMERVISRGLSASDRYLKLRLMLPDRPGQLARVAELISEANANVVEVLHTRHGRNALISQVELELSLETRGPEHVERVLGHLTDAGYDPRIDF